MGEYYDKDGREMTLREWSAYEKRTPEYRRVAETTLADGTWVSTVWLGLNHQHGDGPPLIFETMVFPSKDDMGDLDCDRYATLAEAEAGHAAMVAKWSAPHAVTEGAG